MNHHAVGAVNYRPFQPNIKFCHYGRKRV